MATKSTTTKRELTGAAGAAKEIKSLLSAKYPTTKFSVRSESFAGGDAVRVEWTLGPTGDEVETISGQYASAQYNAHEDYWGVRSTGTKYDASYVTESRNLCKAMQIEIEKALCAHLGVEYNPANTDNMQYCSNGTGWQNTVKQVAARIMYKSSFTSDSVVFASLEYNRNAPGHNIEDWYTIKYTDLKAPAKVTPPTQPEPITTAPIVANDVEIVTYSEKAIAVFGNTKAIKETLKELGGKFNPSLNYKGGKAAGWVFSAKKANELKQALNIAPVTSEPEITIATPSVEVAIIEPVTTPAAPLFEAIEYTSFAPDMEVKAPVISHEIAAATMPETPINTFVPNIEFIAGMRVYDSIHECFATVLNNYGDPINGDRGEIKLDTDGNCFIFTYDSEYNRTGYAITPAPLQIEAPKYIAPAKTEPTQTTYNKMAATIYHAGAFGIQKEEVLLTEIKTGVKYAQYDNSAVIRYIPKGKRKETGIRLTSSPFAIVLAGHNHPNPDSGFIPAESNVSGLTCSRSKYGCFDDRYKTEFSPVFDAYMIANNITPIIDARGMNTY